MPMPMVVNSVAYRKGQRLGDVSIEDISEVIVEPGTFVWLGLHEPDETLLSQIKEEFSLHELAVEDAHHAHQRPKIESYGDSVFIVLKTAQLEDGKVTYGETHLFVGPRFVVSVRHGASSSYRQVRERTELNPRMLGKGPGFAAYAILDFVVDNFQPVVAHFEKTFTSLEEDIFKQQFDHLVIERLYDLKSDLLELRNTALPVSDICGQLMRFHDDIVAKEVRPYLRDVQDHVARLIASIDNMREMLNTAMQVNLAMVGVGQNEVVKRLAGWAAILALPTVVFSLYGMNFESMPELKWKYSYPLLLVITAAGCVLLYRKLRRAGWI